MESIEPAKPHPNPRPIWTWLPLGVAIIAGWILVEIPKAGLLWNGLFLVGCLLGVVQPRRFVLLSLALAAPQIISALHDPYFISTDLRFIAIGLALALALSGTSVGRLTRRCLEALFLMRQSASAREVIRSPAVVLTLLSLLGWVLSDEAIWLRLGSEGAPMILTFSALVGGIVLPAYWFEVGLATSLGLLFRGLFTTSNLAPFEVLGSVLWALQLVAAALVGCLVGFLYGLVRRRWLRSRAAT